MFLRKASLLVQQFQTCFAKLWTMSVSHRCGKKWHLLAGMCQNAKMVEEPRLSEMDLQDPTDELEESRCTWRVFVVCSRAQERPHLPLTAIWNVAVRWIFAVFPEGVERSPRHRTVLRLTWFDLVWSDGWLAVQRQVFWFKFWALRCHDSDWSVRLAQGSIMVGS